MSNATNANETFDCTVLSLRSTQKQSSPDRLSGPCRSERALNSDEVVSKNQFSNDSWKDFWTDRRGVNSFPKVWDPNIDILKNAIFFNLQSFWLGFLASCFQTTDDGRLADARSRWSLTLVKRCPFNMLFQGGTREPFPKVSFWIQFDSSWVRSFRYFSGVVSNDFKRMLLYTCEEHTFLQFRFLSSSLAFLFLVLNLFIGFFCKTFTPQMWSLGGVRWNAASGRSPGQITELNLDQSSPDLNSTVLNRQIRSDLFEMRTNRMRFGASRRITRPIPASWTIKVWWSSIIDRADGRPVATDYTQSSKTISSILKPTTRARSIWCHRFITNPVHVCRVATWSSWRIITNSQRYLSKICLLYSNPFWSLLVFIDCSWFWQK